MANLEYNNLDILKKEIQTLTPSQRIAFAVSCCERLHSHYALMIEQVKSEGWQGEDLMRPILDHVWQYLTGKQIDSATFIQLRSDFDESYPDEGYEDTAESQTIASAVLHLLDLCVETSSENFVRVVDMVYEILSGYLDYFLGESEPNWEYKSYQEMIEITAKQPLTLKEIAKENLDLQRLKQNPTLSKDFVKWLRTSSVENKIDLDILE